jgi:hypothetical protein
MHKVDRIGMSNAPGSAHKHSPYILTDVKLGSDLCQKKVIFVLSSLLVKPLQFQKVRVLCSFLIKLQTSNQTVRFLDVFPTH